MQSASKESLVLTAPDLDWYDWCSAHWYVGTISCTFVSSQVFRLDEDLKRSQQAERKIVSLDFQSLKDQWVPALTFEARFCSTTATTMKKKTDMAKMPQPLPLQWPPCQAMQKKKGKTEEEEESRTVMKKKTNVAKMPLQPMVSSPFSTDPAGTILLSSAEEEE